MTNFILPIMYFESDLPMALITLFTVTYRHIILFDITLTLYKVKGRSLKNKVPRKSIWTKCKEVVLIQSNIVSISVWKCSHHTVLYTASIVYCEDGPLIIKHRVTIEITIRNSTALKSSNLYLHIAPPPPPYFWCLKSVEQKKAIHGYIQYVFLGEAKLHVLKFLFSFDKSREEYNYMAKKQHIKDWENVNMYLQR